MKRINVKWFEVIGLALLLIAFGWQCWEENATQTMTEGYLYETNEKLIAIWEGVYDGALHSDHYDGNTVVSTNFDAINESFRYWGQVQEEMSTLHKQRNIIFWIRAVLYVLGSIMIIIAKIPRQMTVEQEEKTISKQ